MTAAGSATHLSVRPYYQELGTEPSPCSQNVTDRCLLPVPAWCLFHVQVAVTAA